MSIVARTPGNPQICLAASIAMGESTYMCEAHAPKVNLLDTRPPKTATSWYGPIGLEFHLAMKTPPSVQPNKETIGTGSGMFFLAVCTGTSWS
jgi:hypothetical protein